MGNEAIYGNMGSEKTHELIRRALMYSNLGIKSTLFKWIKDRKLQGESDTVLSSRSGLSFDNVRPAEGAEEIISIIRSSPKDTEEFFGIPDVHLYGTAGAKFIELAKQNRKNPNKTLVFEGLDRDYAENIFVFGDSGKTVFDLYGLCTPTHMIGKCFYIDQNGKRCKADAEESLRLLNGMPCPTNLKDIPLVSPGSEKPNIIMYHGEKIYQSWLGVCGKHHVTGSVEEIATQIIGRKLNFPQPAEGLESMLQQGDLKFYRSTCGVWLPNSDFLSRQ